MKTKNIILIALLAILAVLASCKKDHDIPTGKVFNGGEVHTDSVVDYEKLLVGTWGVEKIEYYNLDYAGNPIPSTMTTLDYDPSSTDNGIQMIFREDKTGEIRDSSIDTLWVEESSYIVCPDTILVKAFTYYYDKSDSLLNVSMTNSLVPHKMDVKELTNNTFVYENEYSTNYMEKAYLKRLSDEPLPPMESYTVNVSTNPSNAGVVSGGGTYLHGQNCTVTATAEAGYTFVNWTENGSQVSTEASYTFTVTGNRTLVANFTLCDYTNIILNELNGETKFIEIYNKGTSDIPLNGMYIMKDDYVAGSIWTADVTIVAPAGGYVLLYSEDVAIDYPEYPEALIFHSGLSSKKFIRVTLFMPDGTVRDEFTRGTTGEWGQAISNVAPQSYARTPNGGDWKLANPTPGEANPSTGEDIPDVETPVNYTITVSANPSNGGTVTGGGIYQQGQTCTVTAVTANGYAFTWWYELISDEGGGSYVPVSSDANYSFTVNGDRTLRADFTYNGGGNVPTGAINGKFTINANGDKVYFSQGNLQYIGSSQTWKFADHQWEVIGTIQGNTSQTTTRDLFGWGTSGWNSGAVCYQPWSTSTSYSDYYPGGSYTNNLTGSYANADWGVYNAIYNGGNQAGQWRTLTKDEWVYVFQDRNNASSKYGHGKVNGVNGVILLPDSWTLPSGLSFTAGNSSWANSYTADQWAQMEANGAVFLPAAGIRSGASVGNVGSGGYYWSASFSGSGSAYDVYFFDSYLYPQDYYSRYYGLSVRLVRSAQ